MAKLRVSLGLNTGPKGGQSQCVAVVEATGQALLTAATNKLRLKKKDVNKAQLYVWKTGAAIDVASLDVRSIVSDGDLVVVALGGESFAGKASTSPTTAADGISSSKSSDDCNLGEECLWEARSADLAVVEWSSTVAMNRALGRISTLLEHPTHCGGALVSHAVQAHLPSAKYLGHNLYASTFELFEQRIKEQRLQEPALGEASSGAVRTISTENSFADDGTAPALWDTTMTPAVAGAAAAGAVDSCGVSRAPKASDAAASEAELNFLATWRLHGAPAVVISYASAKANSSGSAGASAAAVSDDALATLRHELCHARFALLPAYTQAVEDAWAGPLGKAKLEKWLSALGYHHDRHADEFGAYLLTEPLSFWRQRLSSNQATSLRASLVAAVGIENSDECLDGPFRCKPVDRSKAIAVAAALQNST